MLKQLKTQPSFLLQHSSEYKFNYDYLLSSETINYIWEKDINSFIDHNTIKKVRPHTLGSTDVSSSNMNIVLAWRQFVKNLATLHETFTLSPQHFRFLLSASTLRFSNQVRTSDFTFLKRNS